MDYRLTSGMRPLDRLEFMSPVVALRCHELVEASRVYLRVGGELVASKSSSAPLSADHVRGLADYYAKLHTVAGLPTIFLRIAAAVWSATDDVARGLWAIDVVEAALAVAFDPVAVAAVEAGIACGGGLPDPLVWEPSVVEGARLVAAAVFDTACALIEK